MAIWIKESEEIADKRIQWDYIKYKIRIETIVYCKTKCKNSRKREKFINDQIKLIEQSDTSCDDEEKTSKLEEYKIQLEEIYSEKTNGAIIRSKARWHEEGEKSTKYFLSLEKRNHSKTCMKKLQLNDSTITDNPAIILEEQNKYDHKLYSKSDQETPSDVEAIYFDNPALKKLNGVEKRRCEGILSYNECFKIVCDMKNNKSPGSDGLNAEFYKAFWPSIGNLVVESLNTSFERRELSPSQKRSILTLLAKSDSVRQLLKNWRLISLLNIDYKIDSNVLENRMKTVLPTLIHQDQVGYLKGRQITDAVRAIADTIHYTDIKNNPGLLLFLDFCKAFDTINFEYVLKCLKYFNFGSSFLQMGSSFV